MIPYLSFANTPLTGKLTVMRANNPTNADLLRSLTRFVHFCAETTDSLLPKCGGICTKYVPGVLTRRARELENSKVVLHCDLHVARTLRAGNHAERGAQGATRCTEDGSIC